MGLEVTEKKIQYILDANGNLTEMDRSHAVPVENPIKYKLKNAFEVFVLVKGAENYWISNYGRCVNNLNHKDKNTFYEHKQGAVHLTVFEIERQPEKDKRGKPTGKMEVTRWKRETSPKDLVAETFLNTYKKRNKIWHKDGDCSNNWYKNLIYVGTEDYVDLKAGRITWESLEYEQEYIEYENRASYQAMMIYNSIRVRCKDTEGKDYIRACYQKSTMWQEWIEQPRKFVKWYLEHYYEVDNESMAVDKDLFGNGSGMYHPDFCCILPQGLNTMLSNMKKPYKDGQTEDDVLPLGVNYSGKTGKYYGIISFMATDLKIKLSECNTPKEAFLEYKVMKQADILMVAARYKERIPDYIYDRLLKVEVEPY